MNIENALSAFQTTAGLSPNKISLLIRSVLLALTFVWAAWCVYGEIHHLQQGDCEMDAMIHKIFRVLWMVTLTVILVFI